ncbi:hypothetical protein HW555_013412 [Spodoptera exigua]|uniref:Transposase Helix-turn-helix domain-containing protein n=1 Tax=Spodoptera exigua TaxID=7107 RepID=A0A835G1K7_SPOEX|nr:hypothetical protein HW555_013412 [Spodoptera exigua]
MAVKFSGISNGPIIFPQRIPVYMFTLNRYWDLSSRIKCGFSTCHSCKLCRILCAVLFGIPVSASIPRTEMLGFADTASKTSSRMNLRLRFHQRCARMRSEGCVCKEPIESLHLPRLGQHSSGGNGSAELDFCAYKTSEECVRGMCTRDVCEGCVEKDVLRGLRILYQPVHRRSLLEVEVREIDMDNWKKKILLYLTICDEEMEAEDTEFISSIILNNRRTHRSNFYELHNLIENIIKKEDTHYRECISTKEKLAYNIICKISRQQVPLLHGKLGSVFLVPGDAGCTASSWKDESIWPAILFVFLVPGDAGCTASSWKDESIWPAILFVFLVPGDAGCTASSWKDESIWPAILFVFLVPGDAGCTASSWKDESIWPAILFVFLVPGDAGCTASSWKDKSIWPAVLFSLKNNQVVQDPAEAANPSGLLYYLRWYQSLKNNQYFDYTTTAYRKKSVMSPEEVVLLCGAYIFLHKSISSKKKRKRWWVRNYLLRRQDVLSDLCMFDGSFINFLRMSKSDFEYLLQNVGPFIEKQDTNLRSAVTAETRLAITLRYLATGDSYSSLSYTFRVSKQLISRIIPEVCKNIIRVLKNYIQTFDFEDSDHNVIEGAWRREYTVEGTSILELERRPRNSARTATIIRDQFGEYFMSERGSLPWQNNVA